MIWRCLSMVSACRQDSHLKPKVILSGIELFPWLRTLYEWKRKLQKANPGLQRVQGRYSPARKRPCPPPQTINKLIYR